MSLRALVRIGSCLERNGVKSAAQVGYSREAEGQFLTDSWGQQVAVMFRIISMLALELPSFLEALTDIRGVSPDVLPDCEPWGHMDHDDGHCSCQSSDRMAAYVHELALMPRELMIPPSDGGGGGRFRLVNSARTPERSCIDPLLEIGRPESVRMVVQR